MGGTGPSEIWFSPVTRVLLLLGLLWEESLCQISRYETKRQPMVTVLEGMCAWVPCNISSPMEYNFKVFPKYGYWFKKRTYEKYDKLVATNDPDREVEIEDQGRFHFVGNPGMDNCFLSITETQKADSGQYYFWMERGEQVNQTYMKLLVYVNVTDLTQKPDIYIPEKLESGKAVTLNCSFPWVCEESKTFRFSWMGAALPSQQKVLSSSPYSEISFIPEPQHHGTNLTCQLTFPGHQLSTERTVQLSVSYPVQNVTISIAQDNSTTVFSLAQENSSWPLMFMLLRGTLMGAAFALTYGLTWLYYTR
ncbi:sialic acid-binding Ig-like lectin 14 isoform X1 [Sarcophilus harrisii]|uniref:sialic acid-binding Ig-like lectin 14 isoform X1 n=1 Tax=Sarcophilus harrisii TaxID=9305 RepID=UPI00062BAC9B|nr:sialic acid-binding Ig-like lectin 14 isoform X1 [Sarcophilus harrisii]